MLTKSKFRPAWWLRNPHAQTLWASKVHPAPWPQTRRERITTPDGDFLDLEWTTGERGPLVILFHGLCGSIQSRYVRSAMSSLHNAGYRCVLMHFRGCSGEPNLHAAAYHSGHTIDIKYMIDLVARRFPDEKITAIGYSLGGNALLKYLARHRQNPLSQAISVSPPLQLAEGAKRLNQGFSKLYQWRLINELKRALQLKEKRYPALNLDKLNYKNIRTLVDFDEAVTAPQHGFTSARDYYNRASTLQDLPNIDTPTHIIFARNDPFFTTRCVPAGDNAMAESVTFELIEHGGHVGFISGSMPLIGHDWLRERIVTLVSQS